MEKRKFWLKETWIENRTYEEYDNTRKWRNFWQNEELDLD